MHLRGKRDGSRAGRQGYRYDAVVAHAAGAAVLTTAAIKPELIVAGGAVSGLPILAVDDPDHEAAHEDEAAHEEMTGPLPGVALPEDAPVLLQYPSGNL